MNKDCKCQIGGLVYLLNLNKTVLNKFPKHVVRPVAQLQVNTSLRSTERDLLFYYYSQITLLQKLAN